MGQQVAQEQMELDNYDPKKKRPDNVYAVQMAASDAPYVGGPFKKRRGRRSILAP